MVFEKIYKCLFIPNCTRKIMWLYLCRWKARASRAKIIYSNPESDIVRSVKTTAYDQNNKIKWNFHIFRAQKSSKSGQTVQGIVQSVSESLSMKWNRRLRGLSGEALLLRLNVTVQLVKEFIVWGITAFEAQGPDELLATISLWEGPRKLSLFVFVSFIVVI